MPCATIPIVTLRPVMALDAPSLTSASARAHALGPRQRPARPLAPAIPSIAIGPVRALRHLAAAAIFPLFVLAALAATSAVTVPGLHRYDLMLLLCLLAQWGLVRSGIETGRELLMVGMFHLIGLALEIFKVQIGSWCYPDPGLCRIAGVPLYSGFMYASVASFLCGCARRFQLQTTAWPRSLWAVPLAALIYVNFFSHHYLPDIRWGLFAATALLFWRTRLHTPSRSVPMPVILFGLGCLLYGAENLATSMRAWSYPDQLAGWQPVHISKLGSWSLLVVLTVMLVRWAQPSHQHRA